MKTKSNPDQRNFSKIDRSGTDPNRYASVSESHEGLLQQGASRNRLGYTVNISTVERIAMVAAGSYLLYKALSGKKKSIAKSIAGGTMLARGISGYCPLYDAVENSETLSGHAVELHSSTVVNQTPGKAYDFWRDLSNLPVFMEHIASVKEIDNLRSHWTMKALGGMAKLSWDAEILMQEPGKLLSWHSLPGSTIDNSGKVRFTDLGNGKTQIDVTISYRAPMGVAGETAAKWLTPVFEKMVRRDLESFSKITEDLKISFKN